jgi:hypothetical protein
MPGLGAVTGPLSAVNSGAVGFVNAKTYGVGSARDGVTDDQAAIVAADAAAAALGEHLFFPGPGAYAIGSQITVTANWKFGQGAYLKKTATFASGQAVLVTANDITISGEGGTIIDGNRTGGAAGGGIAFQGLRGKLRNVKVTSCTSFGGVAVSTGGSLTCNAVDSSDHVTAGAGVSHGFYVATTGGTLTLDDECSGSGSDGCGVLLNPQAAEGCRVGGYYSRNVQAGADLRSDRGAIGRLIADDNDGYGVKFGDSTVTAAPNGWDIEYIEARNTGKTAANVSATSVEGFGCSNFRIGTIISRGAQGYDLAWSKNSSGTGSTGNNCDHLDAALDGAANSDPAYHCSGGSTHNHVGTMFVKGKTMAVSYGEGVTPATNDYNTIGLLFADNITHAIWRIDGGSHNRIYKCYARDCTTNQTASWPGLLSFNGATNDVKDNVVEDFSHRTISAAAPNATFSETGANASGNGYSAKDRDRAQLGVIAPDSLAATGVSITIGLSSNRAYLARFVPSRLMTITLLAFVVDAASATDDPIDVGIYDRNYQRLASAGATTGKVNSTGLKTLALTAAVTLSPGVPYYAAFSIGTAGAALRLAMRSLTNTNVSDMFGSSAGRREVTFMDTAHPLPTTIVSGGNLSNCPLLAVREG